MDNQIDELLTVLEGSKALKCGITKINEFMFKGIEVDTSEGPKIIKLESIKIGKLRRIPCSSLKNFIAALIENSGEAEARRFKNVGTNEKR